MIDWNKEAERTAVVIAAKRPDLKGESVVAVSNETGWTPELIGRVLPILVEKHGWPEVCS
jgi:hypothetical protein